MSGRTRTVPFDSKEYWEDRFRHEEEFEWILNWSRIQPHLTPYLPDNGSEPILHLGCGNSPLAFDMAASGYQRIINVDYSTEVIERQKKRQQPFGLEWITADCVEDLQRPLAHQSYGVVIEKTLTDCIACGDDALLTRQHQMARQIAAVQPPGGMWLCISFSADRQPWPPYTLKHKIPLLVPQPNDTKAHAPDIYYYLYVLQKE